MLLLVLVLTYIRTHVRTYERACDHDDDWGGDGDDHDADGADVNERACSTVRTRPCVRTYSTY